MVEILFFGWMILVLVVSFWGLARTTKRLPLLPTPVLPILRRHRQEPLFSSWSIQTTTTPAVQEPQPKSGSCFDEDQVPGSKSALDRVIEASLPEWRGTATEARRVVAIARASVQRFKQSSAKMTAEEEEAVADVIVNNRYRLRALQMFLTPFNAQVAAALLNVWLQGGVSWTSIADLISLYCDKGQPKDEPMRLLREAVGTTPRSKAGKTDLYKRSVHAIRLSLAGKTRRTLARAANDFTQINGGPDVN